MSPSQSLPALCWSPEFNLGVIVPSVRGWDEPYEEDSTLTSFHSEREEGVMRLLDAILSNSSFADRIRSLGVDFRRDTPFSRTFGSMLNNALQKLPKLESLTLEGCLDNDFGILDPPVCFPRLKNLTCDFPPSCKFVGFLRENPTIDNLCYGGADMSGDILPDSRLPQDVLPNLQCLQCDIWLLSFFIPGRPVFWVMPLNYPTDLQNVIDPIALDLEIQALAYSTAGGGKASGGGVRRFWLGCSYPLDRLFHSAPGLEHLHLEEESPIVSDSPSILDSSSCGSDAATKRFWTISNWEDGLVLFERLRKITIRSVGQVTYDEQRRLVNRWSANSSQPKVLRRITFDSGLSRPREQQRYSAEALVEFSDATSLPELIWDQPDVLSDSDSDETPSLGGSEDLHDDSGLESDEECGSGSDSDDDSVYSANRSRTRWVWNQDTGEWDCAFDQ